MAFVLHNHGLGGLKNLVFVIGHEHFGQVLNTDGSGVGMRLAQVIDGDFDHIEILLLRAVGMDIVGFSVDRLPERPLTPPSGVTRHTKHAVGKLGTLLDVVDVVAVNEDGSVVRDHGKVIGVDPNSISDGNRAVGDFVHGQLHHLTRGHGLQWPRRRRRRVSP